MDFSRICRLMLGVMLLGIASVVHAVPTMTFGGTLNYSASSGLLTIDGQLLSSSSIFPTPNFTSSSISLSTTFLSSSSINGVTVGTFGSGSISISDSTGTLLTGDFSLAQMGGLDGSNWGALTLVFTPTSGSLISYFSNPSDLFALTLNLSTLFGPNMFDSDFTGFGNGNITSRKATVSEPGMVSLLVVGLGLLSISGWHRRRNVGVVGNGNK